MLHEPLHQTLTRLGLKGAADALIRIADDNDQVRDTLAVLLEAERLHRDSLALERRLKRARMPIAAHPADVDLRHPRGLSKTRWQQVLSLSWLKQHQHLLLTGPTGVGKSYLACALAHAALTAQHSVRYLRLPRLGEELATLSAEGRTGHWLKTLSRIPLLILDDFGLVPMAPAHQPLLLELLEDRQQRGSVIVTSQLPLKLWHAHFHDPTLADAILDRLVHHATHLELAGESMRRRAPTTSARDGAESPAG